MAIWERLRSIFAGTPRDDEARFFTVRCGRCGEVIRVRIVPRYDLNQEYDDDAEGTSGYVLRKEVLGNKCPALMQVEIRFDHRLREVSRSIEGGEIIAAHFP